MTAALTPPFIVAALLLCVAGAFKLRSPRAAAAALRVPGGDSTVRALATVEVALGVACAVHPTRALAIVLALVYQLFAAVAVILMRRRVACGCFGEDDTPVSLAHVLASELLGAVALAAAVVPPHDVGWLLARPVLAIGILGAVYATVLVYTQVPASWAAWSGE